MLYTLYTGGFFSAWFVSFVLALMALMILSIPRRIVLLENKVEIQCIFDITEIDIAEIAQIQKVEKDTLRWTILLFGSSGFFGYYAQGNSLEVGRASTKAVVVSSIAILVFNLILTQIFLT